MELLFPLMCHFTLTNEAIDWAESLYHFIVVKLCSDLCVYERLSEVN